MLLRSRAGPPSGRDSLPPVALCLAASQLDTRHFVPKYKVSSAYYRLQLCSDISLAA